MAPIDQLLRRLARRSGDVPYWVLEKDYALSYLLAGIAATPDLHDSLILKGGTALRKGYFADYRAFFAPELLELAYAEWERLLRPFVPQCPAAQQVLDDLPPLVFGLWLGSGEAAP